MAVTNQRVLDYRAWASRRWPATAMVALVLGAAAVFAGACGSDDDDPSPTATTTAGASATAAPTVAASPTTAEEPVEGEIAVFAAASLTDAFTELGELFAEKYPDADVTFNFASSSALATQINEGAPAHVFASADLAQMKVVVDAGNAEGDRLFATNKPVVVVPKSGSPVATFEDLAKPGVRLVLAAPEVPVGRYSREILTKASTVPGGVSADFSDKVLANLQSNEANVRAVLTKVQLGEADAGIVYSTDAAIAADTVTVIEVPVAFNVVAQYPIATVDDSNNSSGAAAFVEFILSSEGQAVLSKYGFGSP